MKIKFVATKKMPLWKGAGGLWKGGDVQDMPDHIANRLLNLYQSPFVKAAEAKSVSPPLDKMIDKSEENKTAMPTKKKFGRGKRR